MDRASEVLDQGLPANLEAEKLVLGSVLAGYAEFDVIASAVTEGDFSTETHRRICRRMSEVYERGDKVDRITVHNELMKFKEAEGCGGLSYLVSLDDGLPEIPNLDQYCKIIRDKAILRRTVFACRNVMDRCLMEDGSVAKILEHAEALLAKLADPVTPISLMSPERIRLNAPGGVNGFSDPSSMRMRGVPSPWKQLNDIVHTVRSGQLAILAARPSVGKSTAACQWAYHSALCGFPAAVFSLEMSREEILARLICARASIDSHKFFCGHLNREERRTFAEAASAIDDLPIWIDDSTAVTVPAIHAAVRRHNAEGTKLRLVVLDYLGLMETTGRQENRVAQISEITRSLKRVARELDVAVLAACQLNRASVGERPQLHHLRESGSIEQDADLVMFLHPKSTGQSSGPIETELIVAKQRNGPLGSAHLALEGRFVRFHDTAM
jgi:replicative DNA helicase